MTQPLKRVGYSFVAIAQSCNKAFFFNRLTFYNQGTTTVKIGDSYIITPGQSITMPCWPGEVCESIFNITFSAINGSLLIAIIKTDVQ